MEIRQSIYVFLLSSYDLKETVSTYRTEPKAKEHFVRHWLRKYSNWDLDAFYESAAQEERFPYAMECWKTYPLLGVENTATQIAADSIAHLLAVNHAFGDELANVFWKFFGWEFGQNGYLKEGETLILQEIINTRPDLSLSIADMIACAGGEEGEDWPEEEDLLDEATFTSRCEHLSKALSLSTLMLVIAVQEIDLGDLATIQGKFRQLLGFRELDVKEFEVRVRIHQRDNPLCDTMRYERWVDRTQLEYESILEELLLPFCLRDRTEGLSE